MARKRRWLKAGTSTLQLAPRLNHIRLSQDTHHEEQ